MRNPRNLCSHLASALALACVLTSGLASSGVHADPAPPSPPQGSASAAVSFDAHLASLHQKLFAGAGPAPACQRLKAQGLQNQFGHIDAALQQSLGKALAAIQAGDDKALAALFHPRLRTSLAAVRKSLAQTKYTLGAPYEVSVFEFFALSTPDGSTPALACPPTEVTAYPHYGYPIQFAAWLQLLGQKELGRIYLTLVPKDGQWVIGFYHFHKWSHAGKTYEHWVAGADQEWKAKAYPLAYIKADIAAKLVRGSDHFTLASLAPIEEFKERMKGTFDLQAELKASLPNWPAHSYATVFADDGIGLLVRRQLPKEISALDVRADCQAMMAALQQKPWFKHLQGLRCSYSLPHEDPMLEGRLGSLYLSSKNAAPQANSR